jgi:hypothetical protein
VSAKGTAIAKGAVKNYNGSDNLAAARVIKEAKDTAAKALDQDQLAAVPVKAAKKSVKRIPAALNLVPTPKHVNNPRAAIDGMRSRGVKVALTGRGKWTVTDADAKSIAWAKAQTIAVHDLGATSYRIDLGLEQAAPQKEKAGAAKKRK